jgi:UDP-N-acetylmuramoyl-L-alanyl-D-glutamate--2,6-diaminopimelate ligase
MGKHAWSELGLTARGGREPALSGLITWTAARCATGFLFAALPGSRVHGAEFIGPALRMGAARC